MSALFRRSLPVYDMTDGRLELPRATRRACLRMHRRAMNKLIRIVQWA